MSWARALAANFGLYVHVPFCARACPYCSFDFSVDRAPEVEPLLGAFDRELARRDDTRVGEAPSTVYIGGGTPSTLSPGGLEALSRWIGSRWPCELVREWTVEFNPEHADSARLDAVARGGATRISLGTQSMASAGLRQLGRAHAVEQSDAALRRARSRGLAVSMDLILGWPGQTGDHLRRELRAVLASRPAHVSVYALTIEPGTPWERLASRGVRKMPCEDAVADRLLQAERDLTHAGYAHYEVSSYALPGAQACHNAGYWRGTDYVGLGPSAASARYDVAGVLRTTNAGGQAWWDGDCGTIERLDGEQTAREALWLGLRELGGVDVESLLVRVGRDEQWLHGRIQSQLDNGNLLRAGNLLRVASGRWLYHDAIAAAML